jgi:hypothetical protein
VPSTNARPIFQRARTRYRDQVNALSLLTVFQSIVPGPKAEKPRGSHFDGLMVCEPLRGMVAHATFQRHNTAHLAILHGGVTLQSP